MIPAEYRQRADLCEKLARNMSDTANRAQLLAIARDWRELAERTEAGERRTFSDVPPSKAAGL